MVEESSFRLNTDNLEGLRLHRTVTIDSQMNRKNCITEEYLVNIPETLLEVLKKDGVVAIATLGPDGPHMVNTWNSYIRVSEDGRLLIPAGYFHKTEANIAFNNRVLVTWAAARCVGCKDQAPAS